MSVQDIRKFINLFESETEKDEDYWWRDKDSGRITDDENVIYEVKKAKGEISKVIVHLKGARSAIFTRMARRIDAIDELVKELSVEKTRLRDNAKLSIDKIFDAEDELTTRVIETVGATISLAKATERTSTNFDIDGCLEEIIKLVPHLEKQIKNIITVYTKIETNAVSPALRVASKKVNEGIGNKINDFITMFVQKIKDWCLKYDKRLNAIKAKMI